MVLMRLENVSLSTTFSVFVEDVDPPLAPPPAPIGGIIPDPVGDTGAAGAPVGGTPPNTGSGL